MDTDTVIRRLLIADTLAVSVADTAADFMVTLSTVAADSMAAADGN